MKKRICFFCKASHWRYLNIFYFNINFQKRPSYFCKSFFFFWLAIPVCRLIHIFFSILLAKQSLKNLPTHSHVYKILDVTKNKESINFKWTSIVFSDDFMPRFLYRKPCFSGLLYWYTNPCFFFSDGMKQNLNRYIDLPSQIPCLSSRI